MEIQLKSDLKKSSLSVFFIFWLLFGAIPIFCIVFLALFVLFWIVFWFLVCLGGLKIGTKWKLN